MNIEQLTKTQIVLLTLLISFITSIATGIVTVTLLDQAPPAVTQTINRVVERTVERVVPDKTQNASVVTREVTVMVAEDDLVTQAIDANAKSLVRIFKTTLDITAKEHTTFLSLGMIVSTDGVIAADSTGLSKDTTYDVVLPSGEKRSARVAYLSSKDPIALLRIFSPEKEEKSTSKPAVFTATVLSDLSELKLGQKVITLAGEERTLVSVGIISSWLEHTVEAASTDTQATEEKAETSTLSGLVSKLVGDSSKKEEVKTSSVSIDLIETNIDEGDVLDGSPLIDLDGNVIGMNTGSSEADTAAYTPSSVIIHLLSALAEADADTN